MRFIIGNVIYLAACLTTAYIFYRYMPSVRSEHISYDDVNFALFWGIGVWFAGWTIRYAIPGNNTMRFK